jgi:alpha-tubulin suppressor-like RCC1 family protein
MDDLHKQQEEIARQK